MNHFVCVAIRKNVFEVYLGLDLTFDSF